MIQSQSFLIYRCSLTKKLFWNVESRRVSIVSNLSVLSNDGKEEIETNVEVSIVSNLSVLSNRAIQSLLELQICLNRF